MIIDNEHSKLKVHEWITKYTDEGNIDVVTGYFTIGALAYISQQINNKVDQYRLILGDIVNDDIDEQRPLDLLNENITIEAALNLNKVARECVEFLKQDKVIAKTLEPNFCHAKVYLFNPKDEDDRKKYFISGSSNLTEAGIGIKKTNNVELNLAETGNNNQFKELIEWFEDLWNKPQAHEYKTLIDTNGNKTKKNFKEYLIGEIQRIFIEYTPRDIYFKILFELFGYQLIEDTNSPEFNRHIGQLENSIIYQHLYDFQKKGVISLIKMLQKYDGAILADAVGLGKTWSALAVMKYYQLQGREILLLCPKKLELNWKRYRKNQESIFEPDQFDFFIRFHTDLSEERMLKYDDRADKFFTNDKPKLIVIDESHNLRNNKSNRYKFLLYHILKQNHDLKILLLSATPINNSLNDIRNQFKLLSKGYDNGFENSLNVRSIDSLFKNVQTHFNKWQKKSHPKISDFIKSLPPSFFTLTDSLTVARTRKMIKNQIDNFVFPIKEKPINVYVTPKNIGAFNSFEELLDHFPPMLSGYQPAFYIETTVSSVINDERLRDLFLVKMLYILMVKRLESSWYSFHLTIEKILSHHENALEKIQQYIKSKSKNSSIEIDEDQIKSQIISEDEDDSEDDISNFIDNNNVNNLTNLSLGKKRPIKLADIDKSGNILQYKQDLIKDINALKQLHANLSKFAYHLNSELKNKKNHNKSIDLKLEKLIEIIIEKQKKPNKKLIIFTVYHDTAYYLFTQLKKRGFNRLAMVSGAGSMAWDSNETSKKFEPILERFAPYTKLYKEKEWPGFTPSFEDSLVKSDYDLWKSWLKEEHPETYEKINNPIDILISTDVLSEGQNLQDADMVINYDIHWNPVRIIQRMGRIDRLGSPNEKIYGVNFWPSQHVNKYLNLQRRIEQKMATMQLAGSEVQLEFTDTFIKMAHAPQIETKLKAKMLEQMKTSLDDLDFNDDNLGFDDFSLEIYRQELFSEFKLNELKYKLMPKGIYSGFLVDNNLKPGLIALLGYPHKPANTIDHQYQVLNLIYIDFNGNPVLSNQKEILDIIINYKDKQRYIPDEIDNGEEKAILKLVNALKTYLDNQAQTELEEILDRLSYGDIKALNRTKENIKSEEKYQLKNFDLIAWLLVSNS